MSLEDKAESSDAESEAPAEASTSAAAAKASTVDKAVSFYSCVILLDANPRLACWGRRGRQLAGWWGLVNVVVDVLFLYTYSYRIAS